LHEFLKGNTKQPTIDGGKQMKKLITLATAILMVFGFTMAATAAEMSVTCENCPKATDPGIIQPGTTTTYQGVTSGGCYPFQYESSAGYCTTSDKGNRIIFTLCDCTRGTFLEDDPIPLRLTVLTDGVYWAWQGLNAAGLIAGAVNNTISTSLNAIVNQYTCPSDFPAAGTERILGATFPASSSDATIVDLSYTYQTEAGALYRTTVDAGTGVVDRTETLNNAGSVTQTWAGADEYYSFDGTSPRTCTLTADERLTTITASNIYTMKASDVSNNLQKFQLVLPWLQYDVNEITMGESVTVLIEYGRVALCGPCFACECQRTVGVLGQCPVSSSQCMYFPFVFTDMAPWDAGIVITNLSNAAKINPAGSTYVQIADMEAKFTYIDKTGAEFTYTKSDFDAAVWAFMVGSFAANLSGTPASGNGWMHIATNFPVDGYQFVTNGIFGAGTLARGCCASGLCH
jgi:hypothetical protein